MDKNKKILAAVAGFLAVAVGGYAALSSWAGDKAEREVRRTLVDLDLDRAVRYRSVEASILGAAAVLRDVELRGPGGQGVPITVERLRLSDMDMDMDKGEFRSLRIEAQGLTLPLLDQLRDSATRSGMDVLQREAYTNLIGLGYTRLTGSAEIYQSLNLEKRKALTEIAFDFDEAGGGSVRIGIGGADTRLQRALSDFKAAQSSANSLAALGALAKHENDLKDIVLHLELTDLQVSIKDRGLRERLFAAKAEQDVIAESPGKLTATMAAHARTDLRAKLEREHIDARMASDIAEAAARFIENGGQLKLTTRIDRPIPLFERGGFLGVQPAPVLQGPDRFLSLTAARLEH